jgi:REP element-mobilizing transposase RayT
MRFRLEPSDCVELGDMIIEEKSLFSTMSELRKANTDYPYFITMTVAGWIDVFTRKEYCDIIVDNLKYCQKNKGLKIFDYVIMPSHMHLIVQHAEKQLASVIRDFKSYSAKQIISKVDNSDYESRREWLLHMFRYQAKYKKQNKEYMFWQKSNYPVELSNQKIYAQKRNYIVNNPVESGLVTNPESWYYSGSCFQSPLLMDES